MINGRRTEAMVDSGASGNFIAAHFVKQHDMPTRQHPQPYQLHLVDGKPMSKNKGWVKEQTRSLPIVIGKHHEELCLDIVAIPRYDVILGIPWLVRHNPTIDWTQRQVSFDTCTCTIPVQCKMPIAINAITLEDLQEIQRHNPEPTLCATEEPVLPQEYREFEKLFSEEEAEIELPKHQPWDHEIPLEPGKNPTFGPIYSLNAKELGALKEYIDDNLRKGYIRPSQSPAGYPIIFVPKKDGKLRLCVDYRQLNGITIKNRYALPLINELHDRFRGAKFFTKLDLRGAYNLVRMRKGEEWKTAFRTRYGHFEYMVMPFGLTNAPATFQALINQTLHEYLDVSVVVYLDDILIYSSSKEEHTIHVKKVLSALQERHLYLKLEKCEFYKQSVGFLGFQITTNGIQMEESKVSSIKEWPVPNNVKEVQSFLGFANFYRRFIKGYSSITTPMTELTKKGQDFIWTSEAQKAFEKLKEHFTTAPILRSFDPEDLIVLETDSSDYAIGAVLSQPDDELRLRPVAYYSRKLTSAELNYEIHDKELLAIVAAFQEWRVYLEGTKHQVAVITDHKNLLYFTTTKVLNRRQVRWSELMSRYNFKITYRKGSENAKADALSRRSDYIKDKETVSHAIFEDNGEALMYNHPELNATLQVEDTQTLENIRQAYANDATARRILENLEAHPGNTLSPNNTLLFKGSIYVPATLRKQLVKEQHELPAHGHQGIGKTLERLTRTYYFPGMKNQVERVIKECDICARNKSSRHAPYGQLQSPKAPKGAWKSIALDFIVKLPPSEEPLTNVKYDSIVVITDRMTKYGYFIPYKEASTAEDLAYTFLRTIVSNHGMPEEIISDRDKLFTSNFWKSLMSQLGTNHKLSTAYHPQTDGQTERLNQTLEQYLRCYVNYKQDNWVSLLPLAQFAYNSATTETTKVSPFYANYGLEPQAYHTPKESQILAESAQIHVDQLKTLHEQLEKDIQFISQRSARYYNEKRIEGPTFSEGDKVYLVRRNIKTTRPSNKLDNIKIGPFKILKQKSPVNFELQLPASMKIHPVFHASLLEPAPSNARYAHYPDLSQENENTEYTIEEILDCKWIRNKLHYLVKWEGYNDTDNTWEPTENFNSESLKEFHQEHPVPPRRKETPPRRGRGRC